MIKKILLKPKDNKDEPPLGLNVGSFFERVGILNPAVIQEGRDIRLYSRLIYKDNCGLNSCSVEHSSLTYSAFTKIVSVSRYISLVCGHTTRYSLISSNIFWGDRNL